MKQFFVGLFELLKESGQRWSQDNASLLAAAIAYYTIFALAPLLVIAVAVASIVFREAAIEGQIVASIGDAVGQDTAVVIENLIHNANNSGASTIATIISTGLLLFGASNLFNQLQRTLNMIWGIQLAPSSGVLDFIKNRALTFLMVLLVGGLLLLSLIISTMITAVGDSLAVWLPGIGSILPQLNFLASLVILTVLFALLFKFLPDAQLTWQDVSLGAAVTTVLFMLGRYLIGLYLARGSATSTYGAAGSFALILLWVYYSAQIFLFGAEFTQVYANKHGSRLKLASNAVWRNDFNDHLFDPDTAPSYRIITAPPPTEFDEGTAALSNVEGTVPRWRHSVAAGLLGLAAGLLFAFLGSLRRDKRN
ncbi:YihY/virulence factor BrkB family protein [Candidatus Leptofilum sp.]|uniref:YihY/virulence factor BrkB family protein n=1 Tax=Candidatus Leptofilum sp. TaxID=3241576 RepID=UPI003B5C7A8B